jgi:hypothetical protein
MTSWGAPGGHTNFIKRGKHAYFECTKPDRLSRLADPCRYCVDRRAFASIPYIGEHPSILVTLAYVVLAVGCVMKV